jgi:hypothetical protein
MRAPLPDPPRARRHPQQTEEGIMKTTGISSAAFERLVETLGAARDRADALVRLETAVYLERGPREALRKVVQNHDVRELGDVLRDAHRLIDAGVGCVDALRRVADSGPALTLPRGLERALIPLAENAFSRVGLDWIMGQPRPVTEVLRRKAANRQTVQEFLSANNIQSKRVTSPTEARAEILADPKLSAYVGSAFKLEDPLRRRRAILDALAYPLDADTLHAQLRAAQVGEGQVSVEKPTPREAIFEALEAFVWFAAVMTSADYPEHSARLSAAARAPRTEHKIDACLNALRPDLSAEEVAAMFQTDRGHVHGGPGFPSSYLTGIDDLSRIGQRIQLLCGERGVLLDREYMPGEFEPRAVERLHSDAVRALLRSSPEIAAQLAVDFSEAYALPYAARKQRMIEALREASLALGAKPGEIEPYTAHELAFGLPIFMAEREYASYEPHFFTEPRDRAATSREMLRLAHVVCDTGNYHPTWENSSQALMDAVRFLLVRGVTDLPDAVCDAVAQLLTRAFNAPSASSSPRQSPRADALREAAAMIASA